MLKIFSIFWIFFTSFIKFPTKNIPANIISISSTICWYKFPNQNVSINKIKYNKSEQLQNKLLIRLNSSLKEIWSIEQLVKKNMFAFIHPNGKRRYCILCSIIINDVSCLSSEWIVICWNPLARLIFEKNLGLMWPTFWMRWSCSENELILRIYFIYLFQQF